YFVKWEMDWKVAYDIYTDYKILYGDVDANVLLAILRACCLNGSLADALTIANTNELYLKPSSLVLEYLFGM
ncbi:hypothetical protein HDU91_003870, partial [Kappamyces sp. JEL0680]